MSSQMHRPQLHSSFRVTGRLKIEVRDAQGALKQLIEHDNLVVTAGKNVIANRMQSAPTKNAMSYMAIGTGTTAPAVGDTTLQTEVARVALTSTTVNNNQITYVCTFAAGTGTGAIAELGLFNANAAGDMLAHTSPPTPVTKGAGDTMTVTWTVTIS